MDPNSNSSSTICTTQWLDSTSVNYTTGVESGSNNYPSSYIFCDNSNPSFENWQWYFSRMTSLGSFQLTLAHEFTDPEYVLLPFPPLHHCSLSPQPPMFFLFLFKKTIPSAPKKATRNNISSPLRCSMQTPLNTISSWNILTSTSVGPPPYDSLQVFARYNASLTCTTKGGFEGCYLPTAQSPATAVIYGFSA